MSTIVTRSGKGAPLTSTEVDANFTNLNADKYQSGANASFATVNVTGTGTFYTANATTVQAGNTVVGGTNFAQRVALTGSASLPMISATGTDSIIPLGYTTKATGDHNFYSHDGLYRQFVVNSISNAVNELQVSGSVAGGTGVVLQATGSDTNIDVRVVPKGTGTLTVASGGIRFPDNTVQTTAGGGGGGGGGGSDYSRSAVYTGTSTDGENLELFVNGVSGERTSTAPSTAIYFTAEIVGRRTNGTGYAMMHLKGAVAITAGGFPTILGNLYEVAVFKTTSGYSANVYVDSSSQKFVVEVIGATGHTMNWRASLMLLEV